MGMLVSPSVSTCARPTPCHAPYIGNEGKTQWPPWIGLHSDEKISAVHAGLEWQNEDIPGQSLNLLT